MYSVAGERRGRRISVEPIFCNREADEHGPVEIRGQIQRLEDAEHREPPLAEPDVEVNAVEAEQLRRFGAEDDRRVLAHDAPEELSVLFAGGVHDGRSAAMVEGVSARLADRGAKVGVLMGTAYLFTQEAVATGAIQPAFQQAALAAEKTALLETAPGHSTRCVENEYVQAFRAEKERLEADGVERREVWESLEGLNLGRLRLASKGLRREGNELVRVDENVQRRDGMVMIGQASALRDERCTIGELHDEVADGAGDSLARVQLPDRQRSRVPQPANVAIVGMEAIFPDAPDLESYWANIVGGKNSIREVSADRWDPDVYFDPESLNGDKTASKWGGFIDPVPFDPVVYGIPPRSLASIEPAQLLALEVARRALDDANYLERDFDRGRASVIFGAESGSDLLAGFAFRALWRQYAGDIPAELDHAPAQRHSQRSNREPARPRNASSVSSGSAASTV